jgi:predicted Zn-dependent protease
MSVKHRTRSWLAAGLLAATAAGCATNPVTGRRQLALISEAQEIQIGRQASEQVAQSIGLVEDPALQQYVQRVGEALARESERPNLPWTFRVVDDPTPNAFALPGGFIFFTRGMLNLMDSEAELAAVLGHEIGHVTARHSVTALSRAQLAQIGLVVGSIAYPGAAETLGGLAQGGLQLLFLSHGRNAERQADELGFNYALREGYDVREMDDVFASLARIGQAEARSPLPSWATTHPAPEERIRAVQARLDSVPANATLARREAEYLQRIDGLVYGQNPRQGFFQGGLFLHPDLRFQLRFPEGWRTQNTSQSVGAVSPQQDAVVQLTLAGASAEQAAQRFFGQQGVQPAQVSRQSISGLPAVSGYFQARTQQGVVAGFVSFVEYGGRAYQILSYSPGQRFSAYDRLFRQVGTSFAPVNDPQVLGVRPNRVDVVRVDRNMSLAEFNRRFPSVIPLAELALINQVEENATLRAGTLAKRVIRE